jgi:hypothetical protein
VVVFTSVTISIPIPIPIPDTSAVTRSDDYYISCVVVYHISHQNENTPLHFAAQECNMEVCNLVVAAVPVVFSNMLILT